MTFSYSISYISSDLLQMEMTSFMGQPMGGANSGQSKANGAGGKALVADTL